MKSHEIPLKSYNIPIDHQAPRPPSAPGAIYVLDREGSRVVRYVRGRAVQVAGGTEAGSGAAQLNAGPTGRIYVAWKMRKGKGIWRSAMAIY